MNALRNVPQASRQFALFASVPLPDAAAAAREAEYAMKQLGAAGLVVAANVEGTNLGELALDEFWDAAVKLDAPVFIHPVQAMPLRGSPNSPVQIAQYTFDTTLCVGSLDLFRSAGPVSHAAADLSARRRTFPYLLGRFDCMHARMDRKFKATLPPHRRPLTCSAFTMTRSYTIRCSCAGLRKPSVSPYRSRQRLFFPAGRPRPDRHCAQRWFRGWGCR